MDRDANNMARHVREQLQGSVAVLQKLAVRVPSRAPFITATVNNLNSIIGAISTAITDEDSTPVSISNDLAAVIMEYDAEVYHQGEQDTPGSFSFDDLILYTAYSSAEGSQEHTNALLDLAKLGAPAYDRGRRDGFTVPGSGIVYRREIKYALSTDEVEE